MTSRNWYIAKAAGLRLLVALALVSWSAVIVLAVRAQEQPARECAVTDQLHDVILTGN